MNQDRAKRKLTAILSADVVGYSRLMEEDEDWTIKTLEENKKLINEFIEEYKGRVVDAPGDNLLTEFSSVTNAVECAVKIQQELKYKNANLIEDRRMEFRIGVNLGEVIEEEGRIYGSGVNIAARLEGLTEAGGICISRRAYDHVKTQLDLSYEYLGEQCVKNISEPIRVYRILMDSKTSGKVIGEKRFLGRMSRRVAMTTIIILLFIATGLTGWIICSHQSIEKSKKTIAVLPFDDLSPGKDQEYFTDGLSEEILNNLCQIPDLRVAGKTSSFSFKDSKKTIQEIAKELEVENILDGGVRKDRNALRITVQLLRGEDGFHLWSETYDREFKDIFTIQEEIAIAVAEELKLRLKFGKSSKQLGGTDNTKAYEYYLTAKGLIGQGSSNDLASVNLEQDLIDLAIEMDSEFALAWVRKAAIHNYYCLIEPTGVVAAERDVALKAINRAISIESDLAIGYYYLGSIKTGSGDFIGGELYIQKAYDLSEPAAESSIASFYHYLPVGHLKRAHELIEKSRQKDELSPNNRQYYIASLALLGDTQKAEEEYKRIRVLVGENQKDNMAITLIRLGTQKKLSPDDIIYSDPVFDLARKYVDSPQQALAGLHRLYASEKINVYYLNFIAMWAAYFGDSEFAIKVMEKAVKVNASSMITAWWPVMKDARQLPQFKKLMRETGLVDYWKEFGWPDLCRPLGDDDFECH